jgi:hypothetical protein
LGETFVTVPALGPAELHLDEFVIVERTTRLGDHRRGDAMLADEEYGIERMAQPSKILSLPFCEFHGGIVKIAPVLTLETNWCGPHQTVPGVGVQEWVEPTRNSFNKVRFANPGSPRARSSELYLLASGFRMV